MIRDTIEELKDILSNKIIHIRSSAVVPEEEGYPTALAEAHVISDIQQGAFNAFKDKLEVSESDAHPAFGNCKAKHLHFYVIDAKDYKEMFENIKRTL